MTTPAFDDDFRLHQVVEQFDVQAFIAQFSVEGFVVSVLPRAAGFNVERLGADAAEPLPDGLGPELAAIIAAYMIGDSASDHQIAENFKDVLAVEASSDLDRETLTRELVDNGEHAELAIVARSILNEVVSPDMVPVLRPEANAGAVIQPQTAAFWLSHRHFQALAPPDPSNALVVHMPASVLEQLRDPLVAVAPVPGRQLDDRKGQRVLIVAALRLSPLRRSMLLQNTAGPALRYAEPAAGMVDELTLARGPYQFPEAASFKIALSSSASARRRFSRAFSFSRSFRRFA